MSPPFLLQITRQCKTCFPLSSTQNDERADDDIEGAGSDDDLDNESCAPHSRVSSMLSAVDDASMQQDDLSDPVDNAHANDMSEAPVFPPAAQDNAPMPAYAEQEPQEPVADAFYKGAKAYPEDAVRLMTTAQRRFPVYRSAEEKASGAEPAGHLSGGVVCTVAEVQTEDMSTLYRVLKFLDAGPAPEVDRFDDESPYDDDTPESLTESFGGCVVERTIGPNGFLSANQCPILGSWEYWCNSSRTDYRIIETGSGEVAYDEVTRIKLKHRTDPEFCGQPPAEAKFLAAWGGKTINNRGRACGIWFRLTPDGELESCYVDADFQGDRKFVAKRLGTEPIICGDTSSRYQTRPAVAGQCGLKNVGNTCFMNSAIQCTSSCRELTKYFLSGRYKKDMNRENPVGAKGELADNYSALVRAMWGGTYASVNPHPLKRVIDVYQPRFAGYGQHDAQELLSYLLDGLHEDTNKVKNKPYFTESDSEALLPEAEKANLAWKRHKARNNSFVADLFQGQLKSVLVCNMCGHQGTKYEAMTSITVPVQLDSVVFCMYKVFFCPRDATQPAKVYYFKHRVTEDVVQAARYFIQAHNPEISNIECLLVEESRPPPPSASSSYSSYNSYNNYPTKVDITDGSLPVLTIYDTEFERPQAGSNLLCAATDGDDGRFPQSYDETTLTPAECIQKTCVFPPVVAMPYLTLKFATSRSEVQNSASGGGASSSLHRTTAMPDTVSCSLLPIDATRKDVHAEIERVLGRRGGAPPASYTVQRHGNTEAVTADDDRPLLLPSVVSQSKARYDAVVADERKKYDGMVKDEVERLEKKRKKMEAEALSSPKNAPSPTASSSSSTSTYTAMSVQSTISSLRYKKRLATYLTAISVTVLLERTERVAAADGVAEAAAAAAAQEEEAAGDMAEKAVDLGGATNDVDDNMAEPETEVAAAVCEEAAAEEDAASNVLLCRRVECPEGSDALDAQLCDWRVQSAKTERTIEECLSTYTEKEQLDDANPWYCPKCKDLVRAYKMISVYRPPKHLVVHFNRFSFSSAMTVGRYCGGVRRKVDTPIRYSDKIDLQHSIDPQSPFHTSAPATYSLYAVSCHMGSAMGGHYTAYGKVNDQWCNFNDSSVSPATLKDASTSHAYLLFYQRDEPEVEALS